MTDPGPPLRISSDDIAAVEPQPDDAPAVRFPVVIEGFSGSLEQLVTRAQRGDLDLAAVPVSQITGDFRRRTRATSGVALRDVADFVGLAARLVAIKAAAVLPRTVEETDDGVDEEPLTDAGRRLAEYRLYKAAADALLAEAAEEGARSFLGMVAPDIVPVERLRIPPERLAAAFRSVLERLAEVEPLPVGMATFSVEEKMEAIDTMLRTAGRLSFDELFIGVRSRMEAIACFLALLELLKGGRADVEQDEIFGPITVTSRG